MLFPRSIIFHEADKGAPPPGGPPAPIPAINAPAVPTAEEYATLRKEYDAMKARLDAIPAPKPTEQSLLDRSRNDQTTKDAVAKRDASLASAVAFDLQKATFLKDNESILPKEVGDIFKRADTERFETPIEKDSSLKASLIQSFFQVQENYDSLTPGQRSMLDEYLKLTNTGKQDKAQTTYDLVFEPALAIARGNKKAAALARGHHNVSDSDEAYRQKMFALGKKRYGIKE